MILLSRKLILRRLCFLKGPWLVSDWCKLELNRHTPTSSLVCFYRALDLFSSFLSTGSPESFKNTLYPVYCQNFVLSFYLPQFLSMCWILISPLKSISDLTCGIMMLSLNSIALSLYNSHGTKPSTLSKGISPKSIETDECICDLLLIFNSVEGTMTSFPPLILIV